MIVFCKWTTFASISKLRDCDGGQWGRYASYPTSPSFAEIAQLSEVWHMSMLGLITCVRFLGSWRKRSTACDIILQLRRHMVIPQSILKTFNVCNQGTYSTNKRACKIWGQTFWLSKLILGLMTAENFTCVTKLKSSTEDEAVKIVPGSSETTVL